MAVHYGKEYLAYAVKSLAAAVDEVHIFYANEPSFGHRDWSMTCPDTEEELVAEANRFAKVVWHNIEAGSEAVHRNLMLAEASRFDATTMAIADADEVWSPIALCKSLEHVENANRAGRWLAHFHNFWRSWKWTVRDHFTPIRIVDLRHSLGIDEHLHAAQSEPIYHFGYAQTLATMAYKFSCHGHKSEFKPGWYEDKFIGWSASNNNDLHPCINNFWIAEQTPGHVLDRLAQLMPDHPHRDLDIIS
jgi:hypothetical protein